MKLFVGNDIGYSDCVMGLLYVLYFFFLKLGREAGSLER